MIIGGRQFDTQNNAYVMGILNVTPDSFSDGGRYNSLDKALFRAEEMIQEGADILDIGAESTRPNHTKISVQEEIDRLAPILEGLRARFEIPLSLDSYKSDVIRAHLGLIDCINDIWGLQYDSMMASLIARSQLPCILMHNRPQHDYQNFWSDFLGDIQKTLHLARAAGIAEDNIILDAGVGFQKTTEENLLVMHRTAELCALGYPVLFAVSRKSVIGNALGLPVDERLIGGVASTALAVAGGASFVRVHDVAAHKQAIAMSKSILEERIWTASK